MELELVSFKICPYVQRSVMTLLHKNIPYRITHINPSDPPEWFRQISPLGKVPLLKVDDEVLFESAVINEFIDESTPGSMMPDDPLKRAKNRAWIEYTNNLLGALWQTNAAQDESIFTNKLSQLRDAIARVDSDAPIVGPLFNGSELSLVDCAFAPFWQRLDFLNRRLDLVPLSAFPRAEAWSTALLKLPETADSTVDGLEQLYLGFIGSSGSYVAEQLET